MNEDKVHEHICEYLRLQYPGIIFNTDLSGIKLPIGLAKKVAKLRSSRAFPDLMILKPRGWYNGLFIELKADGVKLFKKSDGKPVNDHIAEQFDMIFALRKVGYSAHFAVGFDEAKAIIDDYLAI